MWKRTIPTVRKTVPERILSTSSISISNTSYLRPNNHILTTPQHHRPLSTTPSLHKENPKTYDSNEREKLDPMSNEVTKSGTDDEVARSSTSYDAGNTAPENELAAGEQQRKQEGKPGNPLDVSPANPEIISRVQAVAIRAQPSQVANPRSSNPESQAINVSRGQESRYDDTPDSRSVQSPISGHSGPTSETHEGE
ncbi:hypothetical protein N8T08_002145 [Aspergillus melleus]|uniref:Uncharacterized protein n=1 Tax=Aspergillus melleus TaxID=138277 RepID=A0ACC3AM94_9EURO|nr:hypothetical protein N8T08_002145 [Aspergillus melleus]